jgi:hypothetical protein
MHLTAVGSTPHQCMNCCEYAASCGDAIAQLLVVNDAHSSPSVLEAASLFDWSEVRFLRHGGETRVVDSRQDFRSRVRRKARITSRESVDQLRALRWGWQDGSSDAIALARPDNPRAAAIVRAACLRRPRRVVVLDDGAATLRPDYRERILRLSRTHGVESVGVFTQFRMARVPDDIHVTVNEYRLLNALRAHVPSLGSEGTWVIGQTLVDFRVMSTGDYLDSIQRVLRDAPRPITYYAHPRETSPEEFATKLGADTVLRSRTAIELIYAQAERPPKMVVGTPSTALFTLDHIRPHDVQLRVANLKRYHVRWSSALLDAIADEVRTRGTLEIE